jgi:hypothetical protein
MGKFKDNILAFTDEEALNQEVNKDKWEVIRKVWAQASDSSSTPPILGYHSADEANGTVNLDVTDCSTISVFTYGTWHGFFSQSAKLIGLSSGVGAEEYNCGNLVKRSWSWHQFPVPKGAKFFNYRVTNYSLNTNKYTILVLKT